MADPIHIGAPDGSIVEFPAGTSDDTIRTAMSKAYPPPAAAAPAAPATDAPSTLQTIREAIHAPTRALENGAFLGLGDRARALIDSVVGGGTSYSGNLAKEQGDTAAFQQAHPVAAPALEAAGGVIAPIAVVKAASVPTTLGMKTLAGAGTGAAVGAVQGALGSKDYTDPAQVAKDAALGGGTGLVLGGLLPGASKVIGAGFEKAANAVGGTVDGMSRGAGAHLIKAVQADGPAAVQARLQELGPDAMLADAGPGLFATTQGAIGNSLEGRAIATRSLAARDKGTNARVMGDINASLGPAEDPQTVNDAIIAHRTAVDNVNYPAALQNAPPVRIAPIMTDLIDRIHETPTGSMENRALTNLQDMLTRQDQQPRIDPITGRQAINPRTNQPIFDAVPVSHDDAGILHKVKGELDNIIQYDAPGLGVPAGALKNQQGALKQMRGAINDALEQQVPGYAAANDVSSALARRAEATKLGTQYLGNGKTTPSPDRFAGAFNALEPGEQIAFAKGSRGEIERVIGTKANDLQALRGELQGEGGWNTAKIATVHGQPAADELVNSVDRNLKFRETHNEAIKGAQTDLRNAIRKEMKPDPSTETPFFNPNATLTGQVGTAAKKGLMGVVNALTRSDPTRHYGEVARALTEQGAARDARLQSVIDAIGKRSANAASGETAGKVGSVVAALLGKAAVDGIRNSPTRKQPVP